MSNGREHGCADPDGKSVRAGTYYTMDIESMRSVRPTGVGVCSGMEENLRWQVIENSAEHLIRERLCSETR
jgi:hypothetical protein